MQNRPLSPILFPPADGGAGNPPMEEKKPE